MDINSLIQKRNELVKAARDMLNEVEKRDDPNFSAEEDTKYNKLFTDIANLKKQINREQELRELERTQIAADVDPPHMPDGKNQDQRGKQPESDIFYRDAAKAKEEFRKFLISPYQVVSPELRALQVDSSVGGGYIVPPQQFVNELIKTKDNLTFMRRICQTHQVLKAETLGMPALDTDPADPTWTKEIDVGNEDSNMEFGRRELRPHPLAQYIKVSNTLMRRAVQGVEALIRERFAYKTAVVEENAFLNGSGASQPLGVFTASDDGIPSGTTYDISTGNTTTEIRTNGLIEAKMSLAKQYRKNCRWIFHRTGIKQIMLLKDGNGRYIWEASITANQPDRLLAYPVEESEYAPSTFTTGEYVGIIGDFSKYIIADALSLTIQKLIELLALTNQVGFISRSETDGMPVLAAGFRRVKLA